MFSNTVMFMLYCCNSIYLRYYVMLCYVILYYILTYCIILYFSVTVYVLYYSILRGQTWAGQLSTNFILSDLGLASWLRFNLLYAFLVPLVLCRGRAADRFRSFVIVEAANDHFRSSSNNFRIFSIFTACHDHPCASQVAIPL